MTLKSMVRTTLPPSLYRWLAKRRYRMRPSPLDPWRRLTPVARDGQARGTCVDRYYIEAFLEEHRVAITGRVLEIGDDSYTRRFGHDVVTSDVLHALPGNPAATIVGDLSSPATLPTRRFDCVVLTQTLHFIYDYRAALANIFAALVPGGTLLCTVPGISHVMRYDADRWGDYYRFTPQAAQMMLTDAGFEAEVRTCGNVLVSTGFLHYLAVEDFTSDELSFCDPDYPLIVGMVGRRPAVGHAPR